MDVDADLNQEVVYLLVANKLQGYNHGKSRIVYIGRTERGVKRISESAADKIAQALDHDFLKLRAYVIWCNPEADEKASLPNMLERTIILRFEQIFGQLPLLNKRGFKLGDEGKYFTGNAIDKIIDRHSSTRRRVADELEDEL
ncbi:hypothetical protein [Methylobacterium goesingense]|uniref:GIY-YIG nuclease family protein n=1 Tax=Methylobacterium goesingense TaxID=243690 RepID=A0ABV2L9P4_9HYPH|nr:hypothetical protein [Methylobacterium goesingense]